MKEPLISIIIPIYKVEEYLSRCIESVINQTYHSLEIILVDDGSPDNCGEICEQFASIDKRIKVIHKKNGGLSDARNAGMQAMSGKYVLFVDSDDTIRTDHIEILYKLISDYNAEIAITSLIMYNEGETPRDSKTNNIVKYFTRNEALLELFYQKSFDTSAWGKLYSSYLFKEIQFPKGLLYEDLATIYKVIKLSNNVIFSDYDSYLYLLRRNSIEGAAFSEKKFDSCIKVISQLEMELSNATPSLRKAIICRIISFSYHILLYIPLEQKEYRKELLSIIRKYRKTVIFDCRSRLKTKVACVLSYFGESIINTLANLGKSRI